MLESLLNRSFVSRDDSSLQLQVDGLVGGFANQATDWRALAAMSAGGIAYRTARLGVLGLGSGTALRAASVGLGLIGEVSTFEISHRLLNSVGAENRNSWRWSGNDGLRRGLFQSFVTFGALKGAGRLARGENLIAQHLFQDTAVVLGHGLSASVGWAPRPAGSLTEQFLHAEATNLQLNAGMAFAHGLAPGILGLERGLNLSLDSANAGSPHRFPWTEIAGARIAHRPSFVGGPELPSPSDESVRPTPLLSKMLSVSNHSPPLETETHRTPPSADFFIQKIREETEGIHREPSTWRELLENYLRRLRILRFYASLQGPPPTILYPMAGVDVVPSLFFPKVLGIDPWVDFPHVPSDPPYFRDQGLLLGRLDPVRAGEDFEIKLEAIYEAAAREPFRHLALGKDAFDAVVSRDLLNQSSSPRFVFLKGTSYLDLFYNFSDPGRKNSPHELSSVEEAALWLADHYSAPGDHVVLWDDPAPLASRFLDSGRYQSLPLDFLNPAEQTRLGGGPHWADVRVEPIFNPQAGLNLRLTDSMRILKRMR